MGCVGWWLASVLLEKAKGQIEFGVCKQQYFRTWFLAIFALVQFQTRQYAMVVRQLEIHLIFKMSFWNYCQTCVLVRCFLEENIHISNFTEMNTELQHKTLKG